MIKYAIIVIAAYGLSLWLYRCYKWDMNELRGQEALKKALRDAGIREGEKDVFRQSNY